MIAQMKRDNLINIMLFGLMLVTAITTKLVTPERAKPLERPTISLKTMIPETIGVWKIDPDVVPLQLSPEMQKGLNELYSEVLARTYVNPQGERVMLSVAYGGDQSGNLALHKPEHCYGAQGFEISNVSRSEFKYEQSAFPVTRLLAVQGRRSEPITYWATVGDKVITDGLEQKLQKLRYAMTGKIPDGILVRVSTIDGDMNNSYRIQNSFIGSMLGAMKEQDRKKIIGSPDN